MAGPDFGEAHKVSRGQEQLEKFERHVKNRPYSLPKYVYKYTTCNTARCVLKSRRIRFSSPLLYNDPFDCRWDPSWPLDLPESYERYDDLMRIALTDPTSDPIDADPVMIGHLCEERSRIASLSSAGRQSELQGTLAELRREQLPKLVADELLEKKRRMRIACFCVQAENMLMCSHYADQHRGVVLGFDPSIMESHWKRPIEPVEYRDDPPPGIDVDSFNRHLIYGCPSPILSMDDEMFRKFTLVKATCWKEEHEWRFSWIADRGDPQSFEDNLFPEASLTHIIIACRTPTDTAKELIALAHACNPDVQVERLELHPSKYSLARLNTVE